MVTLETNKYMNKCMKEREMKYIDSPGNIITKEKHIKDLGVLLSSDGSFTEHINSVVKKAKDLAAWILKTFKCRSRIAMLTTWKS